jgi:hypothetical protein
VTSDARGAERWQAWIIEGVAASGGSATPLAVSRHVWTQHRAELEQSGDLLYVWQVELRSVAEAMIASGLLTADGDAWAVGAAAHAVASRPAGWDDDEIAVAEAYVSLLRDRDEGRPLRRQAAVAHVRDMTGRTAAATEALFANVSAVVQEKGVDFLSAYPPRSNVPRGVRPAVDAALRR